MVDPNTVEAAVMYLGQIVEQGAADAIVRRPKHPYTLALLSAVPGHDSASRDRLVLLADVPSATGRPEGCRFHPRCPFAMEVCERTEPPAYTTPDGTTVACHLHTQGPELGGEPIAAIAGATRPAEGIP